MTDEAGLDRLWHRIISTATVRSRSLWAVFIHADGRPLDPVSVFAGIEARPAPEAVEAYVTSCRDVLSTLERGSTVSLAIARPRARRRSPSDDAWTRALDAACRRWGVEAWPSRAVIGVQPVRAA